ncbi:MAG: ABC transporter substrate-binding protein [Pseudomonadota bacterium]|nr:ABC transporter substrate-binding protein [Pseudomonadota bacterium]
MTLDRRHLLIATALGATLGSGRAQAPPPTGAKKVLRYAFPVAETSLDPVKIGDLYSRTLTPHIFEGLYTYDHLARPVKYKPLIAERMPDVSPDFKVWTVHLRRGIYFADDPAFKGQRREVVAQDFVYAFKRFADPANTSPTWAYIDSVGYAGLAALRQEALDQKKPFDYAQEIDGIRAIDRYTLRYTMIEPRPRLIEEMAASDLYGAVAREVVEYYGDQIEAHPVGSGPFRLVEWRRSSFIAFERNPDFREMLYDAEPAPDDTEGQAIVARLKGRRLPLVDRVEISIIEENQPRWLSFLNGEADLAYGVGAEFIPQAMPNGRVAPNLAKRGVQGYPIVPANGTFLYFNMEDPVVGGYGPAQVALRRAIALGVDVQGIIDYAYVGLGQPMQSPAYPHTSVYDPNYKSELGDYDPARAKALLDLYGYRTGPGGWRTSPEGTALAVTMTRTSALLDRKIAEVMTKNLAALGIRMVSSVNQWPDAYKLARAGKLQMWMLGSTAAGPDAAGSYALYDSTQIGSQDFAHFKLPAMDAIYKDLLLLPDGPARVAKFHDADKLAIAYMPYKFLYTRVLLDMAQPQLIGFRRPLFWNDWWQFVDIDTSRIPKPA